MACTALPFSSIEKAISLHRKAVHESSQDYDHTASQARLMD